MNWCPGLVTVVLLVLGQTRGDSVTQTEGQVTLSKGDSLTLNCSYESAGYPTLFWYVQSPGEGPVLLLKATKADVKESNKGFEATHHKQQKSFHLEKTSVEESDSAVYYCAVSDTVTETAGGAEHKLWLLSVYDCLIPSGAFYYLTSSTQDINTDFQSLSTLIELLDKQLYVLDFHTYRNIEDKGMFMFSK